MTNATLLWSGFIVLIVVLLALDLGVLNKRDKTMGVRASLLWSGFWIGLALLFNLFLYYWWDSLGLNSSYNASEASMAFLTGYLIEKALSVDNLFVFLVLFTFFKVPTQYQHKVLFYGIVGALLLRAVFIFAGIALIHQFHWLIFVFGAFLIYTGIKLALSTESDNNPQNNFAIKFLRRILRVSRNYHGNKFWFNARGVIVFTPLFLVLVSVEVTDLIFAVDSIPAILSITDDPFIVFTSNVFAILGLRSLYFALAAIMGLFKFLKYGLAVILAFVGTKMVIMDWYKIPVVVSLCVVVGLLALSVLASILHNKWVGKDTKPALVQA